jgi:glycosyltransferase involved in cell wall biosynthesis
MNQSVKNDSEIIVSVDMITYNHEQFIAQAIEGVLMQETNFRYELVIANDCSPDNTDAIVKHYINNHPKGNNIKYFRHEKNLGMYKNGIFAGNQCRGKYIAICEGDDYWTDPYKLQKQVDILEENPDYAAVIHDAIKVDAKGDILKEFYFRPYKSTFAEKDIIQLGCQSPTCSMLFRSECLKNINPKFLNRMCDQFLELVISSKGKIYFMSDNMAAYRIHPGGDWSSKKNIDRYLEALRRWRIIKSIDRYYKNYKQEIDEAIVMSSKEICEDIVSLISFRKIYYGFVIYKHSPKKGFKTVIYLLKMVVFPQLYNLYKEKIRGVGKVGVH